MDKYDTIYVSNTEPFHRVYLFLLDPSSTCGHVVAIHWDKLESRPWSLIGNEAARDFVGDPIIDVCDREKESEQIQSRGLIHC